MFQVVIYSDNIITSVKDFQECLDSVNSILKRLNECNIKINDTKCQFLQSQLQFLESSKSKDSLRPSKTKFEAISEPPKPNNIT